MCRVHSIYCERSAQTENKNKKHYRLEKYLVSDCIHFTLHLGFVWVEHQKINRKRIRCVRRSLRFSRFQWNKASERRAYAALKSLDMSLLRSINYITSFEDERQRNKLIEFLNLKLFCECHFISNEKHGSKWPENFMREPSRKHTERSRRRQSTPRHRGAFRKIVPIPITWKCYKPTFQFVERTAPNAICQSKRLSITIPSKTNLINSVEN